MSSLFCLTLSQSKSPGPSLVSEGREGLRAALRALSDWGWTGNQLFLKKSCFLKSKHKPFLPFV